VAEAKRTKRFERIVMPHLDAAYNLARWLIHDHQDAEDVMQDAILRAYKFLDACRDETSRQWVIRIVRNACYDWLSSAANLPVGFADIDPNDADGVLFSADAFGEERLSPEALVIQEERKANLQTLIAELPPEFREVIILREWEDFSYKEIAEIVGIPVGTVMSRLSRARAILQTEWTRRYE